MLWSDQTQITMHCSHGKMHVWRKEGETLSYNCTNPRFKGQKRGVMIWGCMSAAGVGSFSP